MKRLTVLGLITLALTATLLIGAGSIGDDRSFDPNSTRAGVLAVVNKIWGNSEEVYFGEIVDGVERYLMVVNSNCDNAIDEDMTELCSLLVNPGPGKYEVTGYINLGDDQDILIDTVRIDQTHRLDTVSFALTRGGSILLHFDPITPDTSFSSLKPHYTSATWGVNGRKIAVDKFSRVHICYLAKSGDTTFVWYARSDDSCSTWQKQIVDFNAYYPSIAVDTFGVPWIVYGKTGNNLCLWSEGYYDTLDQPYDISTQPTIALDRAQDVGAVYYTSGVSCNAEFFEIPSLTPPEPYSASDPPGEDAFCGSMSCAFSDKGDAVAVARNMSSGSSKDKMYVRVEKQPSMSRVMGSWLTSGTHGHPSLGRQDHELWAAYYHEGTNSVRYKATSATAKYKFTDGSGTQITSIPSGYTANDVQIANGIPFVVWEQCNSAGTHQKIYYSYCLPGDGKSWSTPDSVSNNPAYIIERHPHVDFDKEQQRVYVMWTQYGNNTDTIVNFKKMTLEAMGLDSARVIHPNGPSSYTITLVGATILVEWDLKSTALSSAVYVDYDYDPDDNPHNWVYLGGTSGTTNQYPWTTTRGGSCRVKVVVNYPGGKSPYDISDANFPIVDLGIEPQTAQNNPDLPCSYEPGGSSKQTDWWAISSNGLSSVDLQVSKDQQESFLSVADSSDYDSTLTDTSYVDDDTFYVYEYTGTTYWAVPSTPSSESCLRLMATDTTSDTAYSETFGWFAVAPPGGFQYTSFSNQSLMGMNDDDDKLGIVFTAQDPDTATKLSVLYMESEEGLDFSAPDTVALGCWPAFSGGACCYQNLFSDTLIYSYQLNDTFSSGMVLHYIPNNYDSGMFAPVGILSENDTTHMLFRESDAFKAPDSSIRSGLKLIHLTFLETSPFNVIAIDTIVDSTVAGSSLFDTTRIAPEFVKHDSIIYAASNLLAKCFFSTINPSSLTNKLIGNGNHSHISLSEGNIVYSYIGAGDTSLIRLWRYLDDTTWVERDTFYLDDDAEFLYAQDGLMYGIQHEDTNMADLYVYDPISEEYYLTDQYTGYYPHAYIDDESSEFAWISAYGDYVDSATTYLHTERHNMNVILPALYLESDDKRSPYTVYRDTCNHYDYVDVDYDRDSLKYLFPNLNDGKDYAVIVEFYTEADSPTELQITLGTTVDTIQIPAESYSWYEQDIPSSSDTMSLAIRKIGENGEVNVSRVIVRRRSSGGVFMAMGGSAKPGPVPIPFCLYQPYPNPFKGEATIQFSLPYATHVSLKVYDIVGRQVVELVDGEVAPGVHSILWEGKDDLRRKCSSGVYFVRYTAGDYQAAKKMVLIK